MREEVTIPGGGWLTTYCIRESSRKTMLKAFKPEGFKFWEGENAHEHLYCGGGRKWRDRLPHQKTAQKRDGYLLRFGGGRE